MDHVVDDATRAQRIEVVGAFQNNLRNVSLTLPVGALTVFTGVSGFGKSSLLFGVLAAESQRQLNFTYPAYVRNRLPHLGAPHVTTTRAYRAGRGAEQHQAIFGIEPLSYGGHGLSPSRTCRAARCRRRSDHSQGLGRRASAGGSLRSGPRDRCPSPDRRDRRRRP